MKLQAITIPANTRSALNNGELKLYDIVETTNLSVGDILMLEIPNTEYYQWSVEVIEKDGKLVWSKEIKYRNENGEVIEYSTADKPQFTGRGEFACLLSTSNDNLEFATVYGTFQDSDYHMTIAPHTFRYLGCPIGKSYNINTQDFITNFDSTKVHCYYWPSTRYMTKLGYNNSTGKFIYINPTTHLPSEVTTMECGINCLNDSDNNVIIDWTKVL